MINKVSNLQTPFSWWRKNFILFIVRIFLPAKSFLTKFRNIQEDYYQDDIQKLSSVTHKEHLQVNDMMLTLRLVSTLTFPLPDRPKSSPLLFYSV